MNRYDCLRVAVQAVGVKHDIRLDVLAHFVGVAGRTISACAMTVVDGRYPLVSMTFAREVLECCEAHLTMSFVLLFSLFVGRLLFHFEFSLSFGFLSSELLCKPQLFWPQLFLFPKARPL